MPIERPKSAPKSTVAKPSRTVALVTDDHRLEPTVKSTPVEVPRIVVPMDHHPPTPALTVAELRCTELPRIDGRTEPTAPEPARSVDELAVDAKLIGTRETSPVKGAAMSHSTRKSPRSQVAGEPGLVSDHDPPAPARKSTVTELPRIVRLVSDHDPPAPARKSTVTELSPIEGRAATPTPEPPSVDELSVDAELRGVKVRAGARGAGIAALQRVLIVLIVVAGAVAIVRSFVMSPEAPRRPDIGRCTKPSHTEGIERRCARDGW